MGSIRYREIKDNEIEKINEMNPSQFISKAWREVDGVRGLVEINYHELSWPNGYKHHYNNLRKTIEEGGYAIGAFDQKGRLLGFITVNRSFFGNEFKYVLLDQLFITLEHRNKGIGKRLFMLATERARDWKVDKFYICAGSAEETIAFYFAIGCEGAIEINEKLYESDPRDFQLEYVL